MKNNIENPLVSVIVPIYNVKEYLARCLESIIGQTYGNLEIILVDDGSTDGSGVICDEYAKKDGRVKVIRQANRGQSAARNNGLKKARGDYIAFVDSDDYIAKDNILRLLRSIQKNGVSMSICGHFIEWGGRVSAKQCEKEVVLDAKQAILEQLYDRNGFDVTACGKLYSREILSGFTFPEGMVYEDHATAYELYGRAKKVVIIPDLLYHYCIRSGSTAQRLFTAKEMDLITANEKVVEEVLAKYPDFAQACKRRMINAYLSTYSRLIKMPKAAKKKYTREEKKLWSYIVNNRKEALRDKDLPKRDRLALIATRAGKLGFKLTWGFYNILRGRR